MKIRSSEYRARASTVWDLLIVLVIIAVLVGLFLPTVASSGHNKSPRFACLSHLKQIGVGLRVWSNDHGDKFPMAVAADKEGSLDFIGKGEAFRHFQALSNLLDNPKILTCPSDKSRKPAKNFATLNDRNLSYFIGLDADETLPQMILSGDRNLTTNGHLMSGILTLDGDTRVIWTKDVHKHCGNVGLADGSALQATDAALTNQISVSPNLPVRLEIP